MSLYKEVTEKKANYDAILLITEKNLPVLKNSIFYIKNNIGAESIFGIASYKIRNEITSLDISFIDEDKVFDGLTLNAIREIIKERGLNEKRAGWYFQQFIKFAFAYVSEKKYYLTWDADTIPLNKISYFPLGMPCFVEKKEYHKAYFNTLDALFPRKLYRVDASISYIAENMMFNKEIVKEIIDSIESNTNLKGRAFYEKIINVISPDDFESGFSEFETYGNYVRIFYPNLYGSMKLNTLRNASFFVGVAPNKEQLEWAKKDYDIISIEGRQYFLATLSDNRFFRKCVGLKNIAKIALKVRSIRRRLLGKEKLDYDN